MSTGTYDINEAEFQKRELEAKLLLGIDATPKSKPNAGPSMLWSDFRESYRELQLSTIDAESATHAESRLDIAERIIKPRVLDDMATADAIHRLQAELLRGAESRFNRSRSPHTVKSYVTSVLAAINWAHLQGWIEASPKIRKIKVGKLKKMKGRPLSSDEFARFLEATPAVVGAEAAEAWNFVLRGLWESALRLDELMHVSWDDTRMIQPRWSSHNFPVLSIPESMQKNATEEEIPLLPGFEKLLLETESDQRLGWVFEPQRLRSWSNPKSNGRLTAKWVGKVISKIGKRAKIVVAPGDEATGRPTKFASAHDLRRSCAQRMLDAGVPPLLVSRILRHASWETTQKHYAPGNVQKDAELLASLLVAEDKK